MALCRFVPAYWDTWKDTFTFCARNYRTHIQKMRRATLYRTYLVIYRLGSDNSTFTAQNYRNPTSRGISSYSIPWRLRGRRTLRRTPCSGRPAARAGECARPPCLQEHLLRLDLNFTASIIKHVFFQIIFVSHFHSIKSLTKFLQRIISSINNLPSCINNIRLTQPVA